jgi:hypothetical protein
MGLPFLSAEYKVITNTDQAAARENALQGRFREARGRQPPLGTAEVTAASILSRPFASSVYS